jgi:hypothetical protein
VLVLATLTRVASADEPITYRPLEATVRVGWATASSDFGGGDVSSLFEGSGPWAEIEGSWRGRRFGAALVISYTTFRDPNAVIARGGDLCSMFPELDGNVRVHVVGLGLRFFRVHWGGFFLGTGAFVDVAIKSGISHAIVAPPRTQAYSATSYDGAFELHTGYTFPRLGPVALELFAATAVGDFASTRVALGARF